MGEEWWARKAASLRTWLCTGVLGARAGGWWSHGCCRQDTFIYVPVPSVVEAAPALELGSGEVSGAACGGAEEQSELGGTRGGNWARVLSLVL